MVPTPGLEPGRPYGQGILSPLRLPIPPSGHLNYHKSSSILYIISLLLSMLQNFFRLFFITSKSLDLKTILVPTLGGIKYG